MKQLQRQLQNIPIRMYQTEEHLMIAAPTPGMEPEDICIHIAADRVIIRCQERGPGQHERQLLLDEWTIGPYYREALLPQPVDGSLTNATYGNGVLVLTMPKRKRQDHTIPAEFELHPIQATRGERVGHTGSAMRPTTASE